MINYHTMIVENLKTILPTYYELNLSSDCQIPCISYQERNNYQERYCDKFGYSKVSYQIKVWANDIKTINEYAVKVDKMLMNLGFTRTSSGELYDRNSTMIQKVMVYDALTLEEF